MNNRADELIKNPKKALFGLAMPVAIAMFVQTMYNIVDTAWVGRLGAEAIASLTFAFPIFFILIGLTSGIGVGINSVVSRQLGARDEEGAENSAGHGLVMSGVFAGVVFIVGLITLKPLFSLFGATPGVLNLAMSYMIIILVGVFFMFPAYALNSIFTGQGDTRTPMKVQIAALVLNACLDPIFIYPLGFGVAGAAIATTIAFAFSLFLYIYYLRKKSYLKIRLDCFKFSFPLCRVICRVGAPASLMMLIMSVYVMFLNGLMAHFGTDYVASFGLATRLESFASIPIMALSISLLTLVGMSLGARRFDILKFVSWYGIKIGVIFTAALGLIFYIFPSAFLGIFTQQAVLLMIGSAYLRIDVLTFPLMTVSTVVGRILQGLGFGLPGLAIQLLRIFIVAVPLAYVFVFILGYGFLSIAWAMVLGGIASNVAAVLWLNAKFRALQE
jgi:putative MATE family efflux protein